MAVENAVMPECASHEPPNEVTRLMRNIIMGAEFVMSHITHFYHLAALSYVQGPNMAPWTPYFDQSYYIGPLLRPQGTDAQASGTSAYNGNAIYQYIADAVGPSNYKRNVPDPNKQNITGSYTGIDGVWDNVVLDYVAALKYRRDAAAASARLGGRTPQIQNGCLVGGCASKPATAVIAEVKTLVQGCRDFIDTHQIPLTHVVSWLYGSDFAGTPADPAVRKYDNDGTNVNTGYGSSNGSGLTVPGAQRVLAWGAFDTDLSGNPANRLLPRGCYEWDNATHVAGCMDEVAAGTNLVEDQLVEYITNSKYEDATGVANNWNGNPQDPYQTFDDGLHPFDGYTNPVEGAGYSWAKSPRIMDGSTAKACQVGPLARMAVAGEVEGAGALNYRIGATKAFRGTEHPYLAPIVTAAANLALLTAIYGSPLGGFKCGFSTMDRHRARALEGLKIAKAIADDGGWCDDLIAETSDAYTPWYNDVMSTGTKTGYGAHEAPRGALAHFVTIKGGKIASYQCVVPTTWNVNPKAPDDGTPGPIESAVMGITLDGATSTGNIVPVEALRVVQGFDPCIACTVH